jgi:thioredoxin reductase
MISLKQHLSSRSLSKTLSLISVYIKNVASIDYLQQIGCIDNHGQIIVDGRIETKIAYFLAAGDMRYGSFRV